MFDIKEATSSGWNVRQLEVMNRDLPTVSNSRLDQRRTWTNREVIQFHYASSPKFAQLEPAGINELDNLSTLSKNFTAVHLNASTPCFSFDSFDLAVLADHELATFKYTLFLHGLTSRTSALPPAVAMLWGRKLCASAPSFEIST